MKQDFSKRVQSLPPERRKLFELYLKQKGIEYRESYPISPDQNLLKHGRDISLEANQTGSDMIITNANVLTSGKAKKKELPLKLVRNITSFLARAFTLSIVLAEDRMYPWYYQHFVQICSQTDDKGYTLLDFFEPAFPEELIKETFMGYDVFQDTSNIIEYIIEKIDAGYYPVICVDEYYLQEKSFFNKEHYVHESLIYGYDNSNRKLLALGFNAYMLIDKLTFEYDMYLKAFEEGKRYYKKSAPYAARRAVLLLRRVNQDKDFTPVFDINVFLRDLNCYLSATGDPDKVFLYATKNDAFSPIYGYEIKYGLAVNDVLIKNLENLINGKINIDYRAFHLMAEHKKVMYDRLQYIASFISSNEFDGLCLRYFGIMEQFEDLRLKFLGINYSKLSLREYNTIKKIIPAIKTAAEEERAILTQIYTSLRAYIRPDSH